jgi:16S rRNA (adenine1518-N6/adenine1519-N6)-dimethyltransferase
VLSSLVRLRFHPPSPAPRSLPSLTRLVQAIFSRRRKTLENALLALPELDRTASMGILQRVGIDGRRRPETLEVAELVRLADAADGLPGARRAML